jgi:hypothetical protein
VLQPQRDARFSIRRKAMTYCIWASLLWTILLVVTLKAVGTPRRTWYVLAAFALAGFVFAFVGDLAVYSAREALTREGTYVVMKDAVRAMEVLGALGFIGSLVAAHFTKEKPEVATHISRARKAA